MEIKIRRCFRCKNEIKEDSHYFAMMEMRNKKQVKTDYVHKVCWDLFINQLNGTNASLQKSNYLLNAIGEQMKKMGMIPEDKVVIQ